MKKAYKIVVPCMIGDTIYTIVKNHSICRGTSYYCSFPVEHCQYNVKNICTFTKDWEVEEKIVKSIEIRPGEYLFYFGDKDFEYFTNWHIENHRYFYLTREEAELNLKELRLKESKGS